MTDYEARVIRYLREYYPPDMAVPLTESGRIDMTQINPGVLNVAMGFAVGEMLEELKPAPKRAPRKSK